MMSDFDRSRIDALIDAESENFVELSRLAGLDSGADFIGADLSEVDFSNCNLTEFNFDFADLRRCRWDPVSTATLTRSHLALMGPGDDPVTSADFSSIVEQSRAARVWPERFFAFALLVDNFGVTGDVVEALVVIQRAERSEYCRICTELYLLAASVPNPEAASYCRAMALAGASQGNLWRVKKARRYLDELRNYVRHVTNRDKRYPKEVLPSEIISTLRAHLPDGGGSETHWDRL